MSSTRSCRRSGCCELDGDVHGLARERGERAPDTTARAPESWPFNVRLILGGADRQPRRHGDAIAETAKAIPDLTYKVERYVAEGDPRFDSVAQRDRMLSCLARVAPRLRR